MINSEDLRDQMDILENVIHFVKQELRSMPHEERKGCERLQALLDEMYDVLDRHGYRGIIKLVGEVDPENRDSGSVGWAHIPQVDFYLFKK
jgi:hypothetical protein